jgi:beta-lactamase regulating signal transducer with metallopeptidase domain
MENYLTQIINYLLAQSWQIAVLVSLIAAVNLVLKNKSAHVRYLLWLIVLAKCLVPPLLAIPLPILSQYKTPEPKLISSSEMLTVNIEMVDKVKSKPLTLPSLPVKSPTIMERLARVTARQWLGLGWIAGSAIFFLIAVAKTLRTNFWLWRQQRLLPAEAQIGIENLFSRLGIKTLPKVWLIEGIGQPFVWGLLRGSIYLPANFVKVNSAEHQRGILGHEISHILRFDAAVNLLQITAQAIFWFHPFVWWANKKIRAEREKCCDEMAIARLGAKVKDYSDAIVEILIAEHESTRPVPSLAVAGPVKNIEERIKTMMRPGKKFYKRPSLPIVAIIVLGTLLAVPTTLVLTVRAENQPPTDSAGATPIFGNPTNLGPTVNSSYFEWDPYISADGLSLYFLSGRPGGFGRSDIWVTTRKTKDDPWGSPVNLGPTVNTSAFEGAPCISADGLELYFVSDRPGGSGDNDLWVTMRKTKDDPWTTLVNLGPTVNSSAAENGPSISADGLSLYFISRRPGGLGRTDIWVTTRKTKDDHWEIPVNLGPMVNSSNGEDCPSISTDGLSLYFALNRTGGFGRNDIWVTMRKTKNEPWSTPINLGPTVNTPHNEYDVDISSDGSTLYFVSDRPGNVGSSYNTDIWQVSLKAHGAKE